LTLLPPAEVPAGKISGDPIFNSAAPAAKNPALSNADGPRGNSKSRLPVPDDETIAKAKELVREIYKDDYSAAKKHVEKKTLATRLLDDAKKYTDDPPAVYVLLRAA